jgi:putative nucleotidyltransferase with HDIG domain
MTGFSHALETKTAYEAGAVDFLAKPFREAELHSVIKKYLSTDNPVQPVEIDLDKEFCKVSVDDFLSDKETECDIYIRLSKSKYIKISHAGGKISEDRVFTYKEKGIYYVYIKKENFSKIVKFNLQVAKVAKNSSQINVDKKINFMKHTGNLILENVFINGVNQESFRESKDFIETSINLLTEDDQMFTILDLLSSHADFLYAHSLGVSTFSVMIGRELGWTSAPTLFKLALGGLFHDIGKKEIAREILEKPRALLSQKERSAVESHTTRGKEILESLASIPSEVVLIAYQHHEDAIGQGFPRGLSKNEVHPLAKVVHVANIFCEYAVKCRPDIVPIDGVAAVSLMEKLRVDILDKDAFNALKRLFK